MADVVRSGRFVRQMWSGVVEILLFLHHLKKFESGSGKLTSGNNGSGSERSGDLLADLLLMDIDSDWAA